MNIHQLIFVLLTCCLSGSLMASPVEPYLLVLGVAQDGGYPQAGCNRPCCKKFYAGETPRKHVTCLALIHPETNQSWLFECTPDFREQLHLLRQHLHDSTHFPSGIFITHAHIGHYAGLMQLGKEVLGTEHIPVYAMPRMSAFLQTNGPWSQLVTQENIELRTLAPGTFTQLSPSLKIKPLLVPHRDEFSETAGFEVYFGTKTALFIPDIDKWEKWNHLQLVDSSYHKSDSTAQRLCRLFRNYSYVLIDGTFFKNGELPGRDISEIPHPFMEETMKLLDVLTPEQRKRIYFIHFNHTNPVITGKTGKPGLKLNGFNLASEMEVMH